MLRGWFGGHDGRPYLEGIIVLPRLRLGSAIHFVMDTGSDRTILMPADARRMRLDESTLGRSVEAIGIGGRVRFHVESGGVMLTERGRGRFLFSLDIGVAPSMPGLENVPSVLGRDVINRCRILHDATRRMLWVRVISADAILPVSSAID